MSLAACSPSTFTSVSLFGAEITSVEASLVTNYSVSVPAAVRFTQPPVEVIGASFCNVTVSYTHPGQGDHIIVEAWLPQDNWNGRLQAIGGGGWVAGRSAPFDIAMGGAMGDGYAAVTTDAGLGTAQDPTSWALNSPGNVNLYNLQNLASVSLDDQAIIGKSVIKSYYGRGPEYSYWNGCSQGGRQGLMLAQRYPTAYDGIAAGAPGIYWTDFFPSMLWPQQLMHMLGEYPHPCEIDAITTAAVAACDPLDGVADGVISDVEGCLSSFDPFGQVGRPSNCTPGPGEIGSAAATIVKATWRGMRNEQGAQVWPGLNPGTNLSVGVAATECEGSACEAVPLQVAEQWFSLFLAEGRADFDLANLTHGEFDWLARQGWQQYDSIIGTGDPDLSAFRNSGGKLVTFHGLIDELLPPKGTVKYYNEVAATVTDVESFFRHFQVPGLGHCSGGRNGGPLNLFDQPRAWVENGTAPEQTATTVVDLDGVV
ncbi:putative feruloyl esterase [Colletotrichum trifolii]|uniref:Carboxylic ester hydrolase n=1 Tax=Colletotrichum trifolii TaxID=5466 RepID=A0A4R8RFL6_COLTR|nr:putative feruloyl esterase [Colletotrichum trifolii]